MLYGREPVLPADACSLHISPGPKDSADDKTGTVDDDCDHTVSNEDTDGCERILRHSAGKESASPAQEDSSCQSEAIQQRSVFDRRQRV